MQKQKDLAKSSQKFTFDRSNVKWMLDNQGSHSEFVGYDSEESKSKIVKWGNENSQVFVVLDRTPFYAESGGQVGDSGSIENKDFSLKVVDTRARVLSAEQAFDALAFDRYVAMRSAYFAIREAQVED